MSDFARELSQKLTSHYETAQGGSLRIGVASDYLYGICPRKSYNSAREIPKRTLAQTRTHLRRLNQLPQLLDECRALGWTVMDYHPKTKAPIGFSTESVHVRMSALGKSEDGFPKGWFLIEARAISDRLFEQIVDKRLQAAYPTLFGHCILGMGLAKLSSCAVFLSSDSGDTYLEMVQFDAALFDKLQELAKTMLSSVAPKKEKTDECTTCDYQSHCWDSHAIPRISCHSCHYCQLGVGGVICAKYQRTVGSSDAAVGCTEHLFSPSIVGFGTFLGSQILENGDLVHIYQVGNNKIINCGHKAPKAGSMFTSHEIQIGGVFAMQDPTVQAIKDQFAGSKIIKP